MKLINWFRDYLKKSTKPKSNENSEKKTDEKPHNIGGVYKRVGLTIIVGTIVIFICFCLYFKENLIFQLLTLLSVFGAFYLGGCAIGFLFALPKSAQTIRENAGKTRMYNDNTNLEEISDWLTKIIVGISLTQFNQLQAQLQHAANNVSEAMNSCNTECNPKYYTFSYCVIVFYFLGGIIIGYMWTKIDFSKILTQNQRDLSKIEKLEEQNVELKAAVQEQKQSLVKIVNDPSSNVNMTDVSQYDEIQDPPFFSLIEKIAASRDITDKSDIQKGRWGKVPHSNGRSISVYVIASAIPSLYKVRIEVKVTDDNPFTTPVAILLHDSFSPMIRLLDAVGKTSVFLEIVAYEAFTVAALTDVKSENEITQLELNINEEPRLPSGFYWK